MNFIKSNFQKLQSIAFRLEPFEWLIIPLLMLLLSFMTVGPFLFDLGYYLDDWSSLMSYKLGGIDGMSKFYLADDRPFYTWIYIIGFPVLGYSPLAWQVAIIIMRSLTGIFIWLCLRKLFPGMRLVAMFSAFLFLVYPIFSQQATAQTFIQHWTCFFLFSVSLFLMILSLRARKWYGLFSLFSILISALQLIIGEYMAGLELVRPIIIWILLSQESFKNIRSRIKRAFVLWIPYLLLFLLFIVWRFFLMPQSGTDRNDPVIIQGLLTAPLKTIGLLISYFFQDLTVSLFSVWNKVIDPSIFDLTRPADAATWAFIILTGAVLTLAVLIYKNDQSNIRDARMMRLFIFLGLSGIVFGLLPGWAIGRYLNNQTGIYNDRFGIPAMIGAAMVIVGCCWYFIGKPIARNIFLISLVALSIGWNIRNTNNYRWSWIKQERFYWQLAWRAPSLEPGVPILSDGLIFPYMGTWTTSFAINLMYPENQPSIGDLNHWFFDINKIDLSYANENNILSEYHNTVGFSSTMDRLLIVQYLPENGSCLWFLKPEDTDNRFVTELSQDLAENIDLSAVHTSPVSIPADDIFGKEPPHEWCYYFQKADLAYQYQNWDEIMRLLDEVEAKTYQAEHGLEYMPFIGGLVHENRFDDALRLSLKAIEITEFTNEEICKTWAKESNPNQPIPQDIQDELRNQVGCSF